VTLTRRSPMRTCGKPYDSRADAVIAASAGTAGDGQLRIVPPQCGCGQYHVRKLAAPAARPRGVAFLRPVRSQGKSAARKGSGLRPVSASRRAENRVRKALARDLYPEDPRCAVPWCPSMADDLHEPLTRARGGSITDKANVVPACRGHNDELTLEPKWGYDLGLLRHSWSPDGEAPAGVLTREAAALLLARDSWCVHCGSTRGLRPWLRQEHGEHQGCACGWVLLCPRCRDLAAAEPLGEAADEGLVISDTAIAPYLVAVLVHLEGDRGGLRLWPQCDGTWAYGPPAGGEQ